MSLLKDRMPVFGGSTNSLSQTPTVWKERLDRLSLFQGLWLVFVSVWIPISISAVWIGIIFGAVFWTATSAIALKIVLDDMPKDGSVKPFSYVGKNLSQSSGWMICLSLFRW